MADAIQLNFTRGEITPLLHARVDIEDYKGSLALMRNWIPLRYGGMTRCPGTFFYGFAKEAAKTARFLPFLFNRTQTYEIEAGALYFRFWNATGQVESPPGTPYEIATPYLEADLKYLQVRQSGDLVFITCLGYWPRVLTRTSETSWALALYVPLDGPYLAINITATTLDPSAASGSVTIVASATTGINGGTGFQTSDIGRVIRFLEAGGRWYWFVITARASTTSITATFMGRDDGNTGAMPGHAASANWRLGAWSAYDGYPRAVGEYEQRLITAGTTRQPTRVDGTVALDSGYDSYRVSQTLAADDAFTAILTGGQLNAIQWIADGDDIMLGTEGGLRVLGRNDESAAFGPLNIRQKKGSVVPTSYIPGFFVENVLLFLDLYRAKLYEAIYVNDSQGYEAQELSAFNEHLLGYGVTSIAYQRAPNKTLWASTDNGLLLAITYDREQKVFGVAQCNVGGDGFVEYVSTLPGTDADGDQVWLIVKRTIDAVVVRTVEKLASFYRQGYSVQNYPMYGFCGGTYTGAAASTITGLEDFEAEVFGVWADGVDLGDVTVTDGEFTLPYDVDATRIVWGYRQSSLAQTLRPTSQQNGVGRPMIASNAVIDLYQTGEIRIGSGIKDENGYLNGLDKLRPDDQAEENPLQARELRSGTFDIGTDSSWSDHGVCSIETDSMYPATVRAIAVDVDGAD